MLSVAPVGRILLPLLCSVSPEFYYNFTFLNTFTYVQYNTENWYILLVVLVDNIEIFIEDQAFLPPSYEMAPPPPSPPLPSASCLSFSVFLCVVVQAYWRERWRGWGRSRIIRWRESLVLYRSFNTLVQYCEIHISHYPIIFVCFIGEWTLLNVNRLIVCTLQSID